MDKNNKEEQKKEIHSQSKTKTMKENAQVTTTSVTQTGNEILGTKEKLMYYLIIETKKGKYVINVGEKTSTEVKKLTDQKN